MIPAASGMRYVTQFSGLNSSGSRRKQVRPSVHPGREAFFS